MSKGSMIVICLTLCHYLPDNIMHSATESETDNNSFVPLEGQDYYLNNRLLFSSITGLTDRERTANVLETDLLKNFEIIHSMQQ